MNKQEAIEKIKNIGTLKINDTISHRQFEMVDKNKVLDIISQIHEPKKPVVPQYVADWYEDIKYDFYGNLECRTWDKFELLAENDNYIPEKPLTDDFTRWYYNTENAIQILVNMHQFGYEVEEETLYFVEIPNPNSEDIYDYFLKKDSSTGKVVLFKKSVNPLNNKDLWLTESEIKKDFEWAWQFAKEVEK